MRGRVFGMVLCTLLSGLMPSCERRKDPIPIAVLLSLTGDGAAYGVAQREGYELAVDTWNEKGGVLGRPLRLLEADDAGDPGRGVWAAQRAVEVDRAVALLGATQSRVTLACAPIAQAAGIPLITPSATNPGVTAAGRFVFRACVTDDAIGSAGARFASRHVKVRKAACLFDDGCAYSRNLVASYCARFKELGGTICRMEAYRAGARDFRAQLGRIIRARPDLLYIPGYCRDVARIARQAREMGFAGPLMGGDGWDAPELITLAGASLEPGYVVCHFNAEDPRPEARDFSARFRARYRHEPDSNAALAFDAVNILAEALHRAGTTNRGALQAALASTTVRAVTGPIRFDDRRDPRKPTVILEIRGGRRIFRTALDP